MICYRVCGEFDDAIQKKNWQLVIVSVKSVQLDSNSDDTGVACGMSFTVQLELNIYCNILLVLIMISSQHIVVIYIYVYCRIYSIKTKVKKKR